jgi:hypothetical protein
MIVMAGMLDRVKAMKEGVKEKVFFPPFFPVFFYLRQGNERGRDTLPVH